MRSLLVDLEKEDPDADARRQLISGRPRGNPARARAIALLSVHLLHDPYELMTAVPPLWLLDLSRTTQVGATLLFDSRLTELATRAVDDLLSQGLDVDQLVNWLDGKRRSRVTW